MRLPVVVAVRFQRLYQPVAAAGRNGNRSGAAVFFVHRFETLFEAKRQGNALVFCKREFEIGPAPAYLFKGDMNGYTGQACSA